MTVAALRAPIEQADQFGVIETAADGRDDRRLPREAEGRRRAARRARPGLRLDGQLRLHDRGADRRGLRRRRATRAPSTTSAATSSRRSSSAARRRSTTSPPTRCRARRDARPRLLARRRDARRLLRRAHGPDLGPPDLQPVQPASGRSTPGPSRCRRPSSSSTRTGRRGHALDSMVCAGVVISGGDRAPLDPLAARAPALLRAGRGLDRSCTGVEVGRSAVVRRAILDKNVRIGDGRADRRRPRGRPRALPRLRRRDRRDPQGHDGSTAMRVALLTREYPPEVYGGAGRARRVPRARAARARSTSTSTPGAPTAAGRDRPRGVGRAGRRRRPSWPRCARCRST